MIALIDFVLLKDISGADHFLAKHKDRFSDFVFYFEIFTHEGTCVTLRRSVAEPNEISLIKTDISVADARKLPSEEWDHWKINLTAARQALDAYLNLRMVAPWDYRTGVSYFLRTQADYTEYFQIQKFMRGQDRAWKPYLAAILGLDHEAVSLKYTVEDQIGELTAERDKRLAEIDPKDQDRGELSTRIEIARDEISEIDGKLDGFDFHEVELQINKRVVDAVEASITEIGEELYDLDVDIAQLERSIKSGIKFDLRRIQQIYSEALVVLPDALVRNYEELIEFNQKLTTERNRALRKRIQELKARRDTLSEEHRKKSDERQRLMSIVQQADTFRKYKALQAEQSQRRARLTFLEAQLARVDAVADLERKLRELRGRKDIATSAIERSLERGSPVQTAVTRFFNRFVKLILGINGEFIVSGNSNGNLEFEIRTKDVVGIDTSQDQGHSYHRLLCALFDLSVLRALDRAPFYHFVYHDGIFEGLDNRVKLRLLDLIHEVVSEGRIQYVFSIIDADLPRNPETQEQIRFPPEEVVLTLNDQGDSGRLFKMPPF
ncbi:MULTISPECIES: DUF2326 domain-containing protein [Bradyrhizobium]|uniref:DUF2326 domain-containing protein n=1 Tax=Bradyrhizobium TaxID=374 RepID=UPI000481E3CE|nr:DUF2326 domain-containing protein [Bradyrhizobium japonicum]AJA59138.1 hypothetical protein RN69_00845 [Bradyrhizobium japonicum]KMJ96341.1 hypothetical protein CF64_27685 [Bradyrhizobium japonicum]MCS3987662.1 uncharacterized protein YydD (DUF2326 family) [Bradyrhizobium japonicum]